MRALKSAALAALLASVSTAALAAPSALVRGFYFTSYERDALVQPQSDNRLDTYRDQIPTATHAIATVHVRVPSGPHGNEVVRDSISEDPQHLDKWFDLAKERGLRTGLAVILFSDNSWNWGGYWKPSNPQAAFDSYHKAIQPYLQAAERAKADFVIVDDEWSALHSSPEAVPAFRSLISKVRDDYPAGWISINVNKLEEADLLPEIAKLPDVIGITAYAPLSNSTHPSYQEMFDNLVGTSNVSWVREVVKNSAATWKRADLDSYMRYLQTLSSKWGKPIMLTTGYKSTVGAAKDPADQPETSPDNRVQADAWRAFIDAALDPRYGAGSTLYGILGWRLWPGAADDDGATGFSVIDKPAAAVISDAWSNVPNRPDQSKNDNSKSPKDSTLLAEFRECQTQPETIVTCIRELLDKHR